MAKADMPLRVELENRIQFETLISDISARFVRLPSDTVDREIERALKQILDFFDVDRCGMLGIREDKKIARLTHACYAEGVEPVSKEINLVELFPWTYEKLVEGLPARVERLTELPPEAEQDRLSCLATGVKSFLSIPLFCAQGIRYLLAIQSLRFERDWPKEFIPRLNLLGEILVNALERRNTDQALRESESRLKLAADSAGAGLWTLDISTGVFWSTDKTRELFGFPSDSAITFEQFLEVVHPDDRERIRQTVDQAQHSKEKTSVQYRIIRPDGSIRWIVSRGGIQSGTSDETNHLMGVSIDITERKRAEEAFRASQARLTAGTDLAGLGYYEIDYGEGNCFLDDRFRDICGVPPDLQQGLEPVQFWLEHVYSEDRQLLLDERQKLHDGRIDQISAEYRYLHPVNGQKWVHHLARIAGRSATGVGVRTFGVVRDITSRKQAEEEIFRLREEYTHIARVSAMGELTASLAHELKQPLAAIRTNAQAALRFLTGDKPDIDELQEVLKDIILDNRRADEVIGKLRAWMRKSKPKITDLDMKELVQDILPLVTHHETMRKISLQLELDETMPLVAGDRIQIQQVILNLILNSTEALMNRKQESRSIRVRTFQQDTRTVTLSVKDNGPGIEAQALPHLFEAFYTTKPEGLGMGLAICRSIVEEHGGRLRAENNPDGGATFYFTLPIARENSA